VTDIETPELWCVDLAAAGAALHTLEERTPRLSAADRVRAADLSDLTVRGEWVATHIALRLLIERAAGKQWRRATFVRSERGKPHLDGTPLAFSISHAPSLALIGLAPGGSIGVDVERPRRVRVGEARRARIEEAGAALSTAPLPSEGNARFLQAWVRLEALAKADGCGIGRLLTRLGILGVSDEIRARQASAGNLVAALLAGDAPPSVRDLQLGDGVYAAVASIGVGAIGEPTWLPTRVESLEKLIG
jgi:4'-phosphopantetheinyl transferase